jgi:hypothetical protein
VPIDRDDDCEEARFARAVIEALDDHWGETEHEGEQLFMIPFDRADCVCAICGEVLYEGPEFEPDA